MMTAEKEIAAWKQWRARCALGRCEPDVQALLADFGGQRFRRYARTYAAGTSRPSAGEELDSMQAWHLLETHCRVGRHRTGHPYKHWLFARVTQPQRFLDAVRGGASVLMRDAVRAFLRAESAPRFMVSLQQPLSGTIAGGLTLEDLLPGRVDPVDEAAQREYDHLAAVHAGSFYEEMTQRERQVVLARSLGLSLAQPAVERIIGCGRSVLYQTHCGCLKRLAEHLQTRYAEDGREAVYLLTCRTLKAIHVRLRGGAAGQPAAAALLALAEGARLEPIA